MAVVLLLLVVFFCAPGGAQQRLMTVDDAMGMVRLGDVAISPDGRHARG